MKSFRVLFLLGLMSAAACVPRREPPPPAPAPQPQPAPSPPAQPTPPPPPAANWQDLPLTPGSWTYRNEGAVSQALFGPSAGGAAFIVRCDRASRQVSLSRAGVTSGNTMTVRTSSSSRNFPLSVQAQPLPFVYGTATANDRFLDAIAFSRGRFTVEVPGIAMMVLPAWPEPARVVEDCRS